MRLFMFLFLLSGCSGEIYRSDSNKELIKPYKINKTLNSKIQNTCGLPNVLDNSKLLILMNRFSYDSTVNGYIMFYDYDKHSYQFIVDDCITEYSDL